MKIIPHITESSIVRKHSALIHITNNIGITARRIYNSLLLNAFPKLNAEGQHRISTTQLNKMLQIKTRTSDFIIEALDELVSTQVCFNIFDKDKKNDPKVWEKGSLLSFVRYDRDNKEIVYEYNSMMREALSNPNVYAKLNLLIQTKFLRKHTMALWEFLSDHLCSSKQNASLQINIEDLRNLLNVGTKYNDFKIFKRDILTKAVEELNSLSDINVSFDLIRENRKIVAIVFAVSYKDKCPSHIEKSKYIENQPYIDEVLNKDNSEITIIKQKLINEYSVLPKKADDWLNKYSLEEIEIALKAVDEYLLKKSNFTHINKAGLLFKALQEKWKPNNLTDQNQNIPTDAIYQKVLMFISSQKNDIWKKILTKLLEKYGAATFNGWISKLNFVSIDNSDLNLETSTKFIKDWIIQHYYSSIIEFMLEENIEISKINITLSK